MVSDLDEELKRVRLQREKLALQEDERRAARRQQTVDIAHNVATTTKEAGGKALRLGVVIAACWVFGIAVVIAALLFAAASDPLNIGQTFGYRAGFYSERYQGISPLVWLGAAVWCYYQFFRNRRKA